MNLKDNVLQRIDQLLQTHLQGSIRQTVTEISFATIQLLELVYGVRSAQREQVLMLQKQAFSSNNEDIFALGHYRDQLNGCLRALKSDVAEGRIVDIQSEARGEVFGDFIALARRALDEGEKKVAAVLACAALEDSLKQCAKNHALEVDDQTMPTVVNALKSAGVIDKTEGAVLKGFSQVRNDAFHARWVAIDIPAITGILAFTEKLLIKHFSSKML